MGGFGECALVPTSGTGEHPNIPASRFVVQGNIRMYPRSGFWVQENIRQNRSFGKQPFANPRKASERFKLHVLDFPGAWVLFCPTFQSVRDSCALSYMTGWKTD